MHLLIDLGLRSYDDTTRAVAASAAGGDVTALGMLWDLFNEHGRIDMFELFELEIGKKYLLASVTIFVVGEVASKTLGSVKLKNTVRVADMGSFDDALKSGTLTRYERVGTKGSVCQMALSGLIFVAEWEHAIPK